MVRGAPAISPDGARSELHALWQGLVLTRETYGQHTCIGHYISDCSYVVLGFHHKRWNCPNGVSRHRWLSSREEDVWRGRKGRRPCITWTRKGTSPFNTSSATRSGASMSSAMHWPTSVRKRAQHATPSGYRLFDKMKKWAAMRTASCVESLKQAVAPSTLNHGGCAITRRGTNAWQSQTACTCTSPTQGTTVWK